MMSQIVAAKETTVQNILFLKCGTSEREKISLDTVGPAFLNVIDTDL